MHRIVGVMVAGVCALFAFENGMAQTNSDSAPPVISETSSESTATPAPAVATAPATTTPENVGIHWGPLTILSGLDLALYYDSNPTYASGHGNGGTNGNSNVVRSDTALRAEPSLAMILKGNGWDSYLRGWYIYDYILDPASGAYRDILSDQHYGETFGLNMQSARGTQVTLSEYYEFQNRIDQISQVGQGGATYNGSWQDRQTLDMAATIDEPLGEKTGISAGLSMNDLGYDNQYLYDWASINGTLGLRRQLTSKMDALVDLGYSVQQSENSNGDSDLWTATMGVGSKATPATSYKAELGLMGYRYNDGEYSAASWTYNLSGTWIINPRLSTTVNGTADFQPSEVDRNNYVKVQTLSDELTYLATRRLTTTLSCVYRREDYGEPFLGEANRIDNQFSIYARGDYRLQRHVTLFVIADFSKNSSTISYWDYDALFLEAGVNLRF